MAFLPDCSERGGRGGDSLRHVTPRSNQRDRIDHDGGFLPLELVDSADPSAGNSLLQLEDLCIVRGDDEDVVETDRSHYVFPVSPD